jgi:organic radical activating enzyme
MHGKNPIRPPQSGDGRRIDVQHIFSTIQGEGPYAGVPAVFIRLGGCNLACEFCDTEFESFREMGMEDIVERVGELSSSCVKAQDLRLSTLALDPAVKPQDDKNIKLIVITGGEPLRQPIAPLCEALIAKGHKVQISRFGAEAGICRRGGCGAEWHACLRAADGRIRRGQK